MSEMTRARQVLASALRISEPSVPTEAAIGVTPEWDSLAHMRLILGLEEMIGKQLEMEQVVEIGNLQDIIEILDQHTALLDQM